MKALEFIFSSFWIFVGVIVIISVTLNGIAEIVRNIKQK